MAQSAEYPDLRWIPPKAYGTGRDGKAVRYIVVHYTAGSENASSAENGAFHNQTRTDGTSAHYFVDQDSVIQGVLTRNRANCARHRGNRLGIQYELCGTVQTRAQWLDSASNATLTLAARQMARDVLKYSIPVKRLTVAQTRAAWTQFPNGPKGFVGHVDCTKAYPEDGGDHTDPGVNFPWDILLARVASFVNGGTKMTDLTWQHVDASLPILRYGYEDGTYVDSKTSWVARVQRDLKIQDDGIYGDQTKAAIAALKIPGHDGSVVDMAVWEKLNGLWGATQKLNA